MLPVFRCISQNSKNRHFRKIHVLWLSFWACFWKSWFYTCKPMRENHRWCLCFGVFLRIFKITIFVKSMFCDLIYFCVFGKSWFYACDPICENHRFCLCFGVFLRIFKITIFVKFMFCDLVFEWFWGNRGSTHATRFWKTMDFACVLVYFSEFSKSTFS